MKQSAPAPPLNSYLPYTENKARILVVDDEATNVNLIQRYLEREGFVTLSAVNGQEAIQKVWQEMPDVIILDIRMPMMDGLSVCRELRQDFRTRGIPIILLTAKGALEDRLEGFRAGADDFLRKPFDLEELRVRVEGALQRRRWDQGTHPLTHLPGSPAIEDEIRRRLATGLPFAFAYIDIDYFKAYNDNYGYEAGDRVIKELADFLIKLAMDVPSSGVFPAHIGGDDFVAIAPIEVMREALPRMAVWFDERRAAHYRAEDLKAGKVRSKDRRGLDQDFPLMTLSVAVVSTETRKVSHHARLGELASELKSFLKAQDHQGKSLVMWDRRSDQWGPV